MTETAYTGPSFATDQIAANLTAMQYAVYEHFDIESIPEDEGTLQEMRDWAADQLRKTCWFDLIDEGAINWAEDMYNAHFIAEVAADELGLGE